MNSLLILLIKYLCISKRQTRKRYVHFIFALNNIFLRFLSLWRAKSLNKRFQFSSLMIFIKRRFHCKDTCKHILDNGYYSHPMLVYLFNINITITKVCVLFVFSTFLNIVINYKVISKWNQPIIVVMDNSYCSLGEPESMCLILDKFNFIIHSARHSYSETGNICPSFMTLGHFILFAKL